MIAAEVRAALARKKGLNSNTLPSYIGRSQRYWNERLNARVDFGSDDLAKLSWLLQVPMSQFVPAVIADIDPSAPSGPAAVGGGRSFYDVPRRRSIGLEPVAPTVEYGRFADDHLATVTPIRSNAA